MRARNDARAARHFGGANLTRQRIGRRAFWRNEANVAAADLLGWQNEARIFNDIIWHAGIAMIDPSRSRNLGFFFDAAVREVPEKIAVIDLHGGRERNVTYRHLDARMDRVAAMLAGLGARPGERVGMLIGNRVEFLECF